MGIVLTSAVRVVVVYSVGAVSSFVNELFLISILYISVTLMIFCCYKSSIILSSEFFGIQLFLIMPLFGRVVRVQLLPLRWSSGCDCLLLFGFDLGYLPVCIKSAP